MNSFFYFLPGVKESEFENFKLIRRHLDRLGLEYLEVSSLADLTLSRVVFPADGNDVDGCLMSLVRDGQPIDLHKLNPSGQVWVRCPDGCFWVGCWKDPGMVPVPEQLARKKVCDGYPVGLGGRRWMVPILHSQPGNGQSGCVTLPSDVVFGPEGVECVAKPEFEELFSIGRRLFDHWLVADPALTLGLGELTTLVLRVLQVNYQIGKGEVNLLQKLGVPVFDQTVLQTMALAAIDLPKIKEAAEKKP